MTHIPALQRGARSDWVAALGRLSSDRFVLCDDLDRPQSPSFGGYPPPTAFPGLHLGAAGRCARSRRGPWRLVPRVSGSIRGIGASQVDHGGGCLSRSRQPSSRSQALAGRSWLGRLAWPLRTRSDSSCRFRGATREDVRASGHPTWLSKNVDARRRLPVRGRILRDSTIRDKGFTPPICCLTCISGARDAPVTWAPLLLKPDDQPCQRGRDAGRTRGTASERRGRVSFPGRRADVREAACRECDIVICPSRRESFREDDVAAEAMMNGLPVVGLSRPRARYRELIGDEGDCCSPVGDGSAAAASGIDVGRRTALSGPSSRRRAGAAGRTIPNPARWISRIHRALRASNRL